MKAAAETFIRTGFFSKGMYRLSATLTVISMLFLSSCEIEDDFGKPDNSSQPGTLIYNSPYGVSKLFWSEQTDQIVTIGDGINVIDLSTKTSNHLNPNNFSYHISNQSWLTGNIIYYLNNSLELASIDITNGNQKLSLADSIMESYESVPVSTEYFAFNKQHKSNLANEPYLYLFDIATGKETLITTGSPITFSPDGKNLLFLKYNPSTYTRLYYIYSIEAKSVTPLQVTEPYGNVGPMKWTSVGILLYVQGYSGKSEVYNVTTNSKIGEWENMMSPTYGVISSSGKKMMTYKEKCASNVSGYCTSYYKQYYSVVDVLNSTVSELVYGNGLYVYQFAFSPDENSAVYSPGNGIYLIESFE